MELDPGCVVNSNIIETVGYEMYLQANNHGYKIHDFPEDVKGGEVTDPAIETTGITTIIWGQIKS